MKPQAIFDQVTNHLLAQGRTAMIRLKGEPLKTCAYRGRGQTSCAMGCTIPDDLYHFEYEGSSLENLQDRADPKYTGASWARPRLSPEARASFNAWVKLVGKANLGLIERLQAVHDLSDTHPWKRSKTNRRRLLIKLSEVARDFNLKTAHLPAFEELTGVSKRAS